MKMTRRQFLKISAAAVAAPAIVKAENLMPIVPPEKHIWVHDERVVAEADVWVSDFGMLDVIRDANLYGQGVGLVNPDGSFTHVPIGNTRNFSMKRKPIQRRTAEEAIQAALQDAWKRGGDPQQIAMSPDLLQFFRDSSKFRT